MNVSNTEQVTYWVMKAWSTSQIDVTWIQTIQSICCLPPMPGVPSFVFLSFPPVNMGEHSMHSLTGNRSEWCNETCTSITSFLAELNFSDGCDIHKTFVLLYFHMSSSTHTYITIIKSLFILLESTLLMTNPGCSSF